jgi:hypothetical protein
MTKKSQVVTFAITTAFALMHGCTAFHESEWDTHHVMIGRFDVSFEIARNQSHEGPGQQAPLESIPLGDYDDRNQFRQIMNPFWDFRTSPFRPVDGTLSFELAIVGLSRPVPISQDHLSLLADQYHSDLVESVEIRNEERKRDGKPLSRTPTRTDYQSTIHNGCLALRIDWRGNTRLIIPLTERFFLLARLHYYVSPGMDQFERTAKSAMARMIDSITVTDAAGASPPPGCIHNQSANDRSRNQPVE